MNSLEVQRIVVLLAIGLVWLYANIKAGANWLKVITLTGFLVFVGLASVAAIMAVFT